MCTLRFRVWELEFLLCHLLTEFEKRPGTNFGDKQTYLRTQISRPLSCFSDHDIDAISTTLWHVFLFISLQYYLFSSVLFSFLTGEIWEDTGQSTQPTPFAWTVRLITSHGTHHLDPIEGRCMDWAQTSTKQEQSNLLSPGRMKMETLTGESRSPHANLEKGGNPEQNNECWTHQHV